jgi:hypothetical protein
MRRLRFWLKIIGVVLGFFIILTAAFLWWLLPGRYRMAKDIILPIHYAGDRFFAEPVTTAGVKLTMLTDTGGGLMLSTTAAKRCALRPKKLLGMPLSRLPAFRADAWIPEPTGAEKWMLVSGSVGFDGMLGERWFAGGVWTFDYPDQKLILRSTSFAPTPEMRRHAVPLGFHRATLGYCDHHHPRIVVTVAGAPVEALFDTGATVWLSPEAVDAMRTEGDVERGTSFVTARLFEQWHRNHPEWRVIRHGCTLSHAALIEVPEVEVAGFKAGPVWFTERADANYVNMSQSMDRPISAAIGGNFLKHFRVTVDYPGATAYFENPAGNGLTTDPAMRDR